jgi:hypothetical protein
VTTYYCIEYYNKLFKQWLRYNQLKYPTQEQAQEEIDNYTKHKLEIEMRIYKLEILPKIKKKKIKTIV